ncbi:MAG TPA: NAD(P)H-binding protein [Mucilaginibacter sp.]|jgi:uncharacterized protein YbjT (DUF2867 family)|nr:NAD(P)H-binding protein [Mucilaginibacter sp.]
MRVLVLGATGRTGSYLVSEAIKTGYTVNVLVRDKNRSGINSGLISVFEGVPTNKAELLAAMQNCDAILSALNISRTSDFPWAKLRTPENFLSASIKNIIEAAVELNVKRIIITSAWGVAETKKDIPWWFRLLIDHSNIGYAYRDHERQEELLKNSNLNWTAVRPVGLTNSTKEKETLVSLDNSPRPNLTIGRQNVARFMVRALKDGAYIRQNPVVSCK